jgi:hypothetical protein
MPVTSSIPPLSGRRTVSMVSLRVARSIRANLTAGRVAELGPYGMASRNRPLVSRATGQLALSHRRRGSAEVGHQLHGTALPVAVRYLVILVIVVTDLGDMRAVVATACCTVLLLGKRWLRDGPKAGHAT